MKISNIARSQPSTTALQSQHTCIGNQLRHVFVMGDAVEYIAIYDCIFVHDLDLALGKI